MSNPTIELGGGKWATKPTSLLAFNQHPEWGYNPKEFTVDRNSTATCVGSDGLIKTVQANEARIDYSNDPNGALLVEPQRTNLLSYSSNLTNWTKMSSTVYNTNELGLDGISPLYRFDENTNDNYHAINITWSATVGKPYTFSFYAKAIGRTHIKVRHAISGWDQAIKVDLANGVVVGTSVGTGSGQYRQVDSYKVEPIGDFYRVQYTVVAPNTASVATFIFLDNDTVDTNANGNPTYVGDGTQGIAVWGAQCEEASTASSLIPTNGTTVTRLGDMIENTDENSITDTYTIYAELVKYHITPSRYFLHFENGQADDWYVFDNNGYNNVYFPNQGGYIFGNNSNAIGNDGNVKLAFRYDKGQFSFFGNGNLVGQATLSLDGLNKIQFRNDYNGGTIAEHSNFKVYPTALTDQELIDLTTI
jgi:hypothetical protein